MLFSFSLRGCLQSKGFSVFRNSIDMLVSREGDIHPHRHGPWNQGHDRFIVHSLPIYKSMSGTFVPNAKASVIQWISIGTVPVGKPVYTSMFITSKSYFPDLLNAFLLWCCTPDVGWKDTCHREGNWYLTVRFYTTISFMACLHLCPQRLKHKLCPYILASLYSTNTYCSQKPPVLNDHNKQQQFPRTKTCISHTTNPVTRDHLSLETMFLYYKGWSFKAGSTV